MKNWKIGFRITAGFAAIIFTTAALGWFSLNRNANIGKHAQALRGNYLPSVIALMEIKADQYHSAAALLEICATDDVGLTQKLEGEINASRAAVEKNLRFYESTPFTPEEAALYEAAKATREAYVAKFEEVQKIGSGTEPTADAKARAMFVKDLRPLYEKYSDQIGTLVDMNERGANAGMASILSSVASADGGIWIGMLICIVVSIPITVFIVRSITAPLALTVEAVERLAAGDLTTSLDLRSKDEVGQMAEALNTAIEKLRATMQEVAESAANSNTSSQELAAAAEQLASGAQEQAASLEETSASLEQITAAVRQSADNAKQASQLATGSRESAEQGQEVVSSAIGAMAEINTASAKISDIISTINEIAFQTNLLAVNAAVEAARAGEEGRGFAVVATEVRSLAQRSAEAAKEIKGLIQDSLEKVEKGSELVNRSGATLQGIVGSVKRVTDIVGEIAAASSEQSLGVDQVNTAITQMDQVTQSNSAQTEELSSTAQTLSGQAARLLELLSSFTLGNGSEALHGGLPHQPGPRASRAANGTPRRPASSATGTAAGRAAKAANGRKQPTPVLAGAPGVRSDDASFEEF
jgi:methyl-accepting chemotaxis protein